MVNVKRLPGVFFTHKIKIGLIWLTLTAALSCFHHWSIVCTNHEIKKELTKLCQIHDEGKAVGNLCKPLCKEKAIESIECRLQNSDNQFAFVARWNSRLIVLKSSVGGEEIPSRENTLETVSERKNWSYSLNEPKYYVPSASKYDEENAEGLNEKEFEDAVRRIVSEQLNVTVTKSQLKALQHLQVKSDQQHPESGEVRRIERANLLRLLHNREYLISHLFSDREIFPRVVGTCGYFFAVEHLPSPEFNSFFILDDKEEWFHRMKLAIEIMDYIDELETSFPDVFHLCDIKMSQFGVAKSGRLKFLDINSVYTKSNLEKRAIACHVDEDCAIKNCKSLCNPRTNLCDRIIVNNNLQIICEKVFVGWTMSGKILVPGLLMSEHTPPSLATLLRLCAENGRSPVPQHLRRRLYTTLTQIYQLSHTDTL